MASCRKRKIKRPRHDPGQVSLKTKYMPKDAFIITIGRTQYVRHPDGTVTLWTPPKKKSADAGEW